MIRRFLRRAHREEAGATLVIATLIFTTMVGFAALLVDLGQLRSTSRSDQLSVDLAALAGGKQMTAGNPNQACQDIVSYMNVNDKRITTAISPSSLCSTITNACTNATAEKSPSTTVGDVTVSVHYPVPAAEIKDANWSIPGLNDGTQCRRMRVTVATRDASMFARIFGIGSKTTTRSATVRPTNLPGNPPALWLLDPTGCVPLKVDGGSQVTVGTSTEPGVITLNSDGSTCTGSSSTISATGSGTLVNAIAPPSGAAVGTINLAGLPPGQGICSLPACDPLDVSGGRIAPQPQYGDAVSRSYIDWVYNCKTGYPTYHGQAVPDCPNTAASGGTAYAYIDNLKTAVGSSGTPAGYTVIQGGNCSPNASITYPVGNYYVKCTKGNNGYVVNGGVTVTFSGGNVVFEDNVTVSNGGTLKFNTANTNASLPASCTPPSVSTPCLANSSANAAFVFIRGDATTSFSTSGTGTVVANHTFVYGGTGSVAFSGAPPTWTAPTEGPFARLAYWTDMPATATNAQRSSFVITGGSGATLTGTFFTPEATPFKLAGGGNWGQQRAQFISFDLTVTGGGVVNMAPDPGSVSPPILKGYLIR
jgi:hypothetical protein